MLNAFTRWWKGWIQGPEEFLLGAIAFMTLLGMSQSHSGPSKAVFWFFCVPLVLWILVRRRGWRRLWANIPFRWALGFLLLYPLSVTWSVSTTHDAKMDVVTQSIETIFFVVALFFAFQSSNCQKFECARLLVISCVIGAIVSLVSFYSDHSVAARLNSTEVYLLGYPTKAPVVLLGCLITAGLLFDRCKTRGWQWWLLAGFGMVGVFVFMTQTRGALISFCCLALLWGAYYLGIRKTLAILALLAAVAVLVILNYHPLDRAWTARLAVGAHSRIVIWVQVLQTFLDTPWLGHGGAAIFEDSPTSTAIARVLGSNIQHPHGLFFSMLYYFGVAGLLIWLGYLATIARNLWLSGGRKWLGGFALVSLLLMTSTNTHILIAEVSKEWWVWWLPSVAIATFADSASLGEAGKEETSGPRPQPNGTDSA